MKITVIGYMPEEDTMLLTPEACDLEAFKRLKYMKDNIGQFVKQGENLYIWSNNVGNGKTTWTKKLALAYDTYRFNRWKAICEERYADQEELTIGYEKNTMFIRLSEFFIKKKGDFDNFELEDHMKNIPFLVIDEIGTKPATQYESDLFEDIVNYRLENGKTTIYTGNCSPEQLNKCLDSRLVSRICGNAICVEFKGKDNRTKNIS